MKNSLYLALALLIATPVGAGHHGHGRPAPGDPAPGYEAPTTAGGTATLADHLGDWVVLYFFPRTFTPGCTAQSCALRDGYGAIAALGAEIVGVSLDSPESQAAFRSEHELPFHLVSDGAGGIAASYGVLAPGGNYALRVTYLIDPEGTVAAVVDEVDPARHDKQVIDLLATATGHAGTTLEVPRLYAVKFHAEWCKKCQAMAEDWASTIEARSDSEVLFVRFDFTDDATTEQSGLLAGALGLGEIYLENEELTGFALLVDPGSGSVVGEVKSTMDAEEMGAAIAAALATTGE